MDYVDWKNIPHGKDCWKRCCIRGKISAYFVFDIEMSNSSPNTEPPERSRREA
jgi:hypothetical protein